MHIEAAWRRKFQKQVGHTVQTWMSYRFDVDDIPFRHDV